jgi:phage shock protein C
MTSSNAGQSRPRRKRLADPAPPRRSPPPGSGAPPEPGGGPDASGWAGSPPGSGQPAWSYLPDRLYRSVQDRVFAGVCGGIAERYGLDPALVRITWAVLTLLTGIIPFLLLYVIWAMVVPEGSPGAVQPGGAPFYAAPPPGASAPGAPAAGPQPSAGFASASDPTTGWGAGHPPGWVPPARRSGSGAVVIGVLLIAIGAIFLAREYLYVDWDVIWPAALILVGIVVVAGAMRGRA